MEMTTEELGQASRALAELMKENRPFRLGLALRRVARQIEPAVQDAAELERGIVERHARRDEQGEPVSGRDAAGEVQQGTVEITDPAAFHAELETLRRTRIKVQVDPLTPEDFRDPGPDVAPWVLLALGELIDDRNPAALS
ncbi:MAG TPA: hypothetical protein VF710_13405 [Longimicrobium sp.]